MYAAYLARFLLPQSVCQYINFVGLLHREMGYANPLKDNWILSSVLKGIRRTFGVPPTPRLPLTPDILIRIRSRLNLNFSMHASFWAICLVAFFGLFRKSHLLPESGPKFSPARQFTRSDFCYSESGFTVTVRWSKTIQFGQRTVLIPLVGNPGSPLCPVQAVRRAFSFTQSASPNSQAFCWRDAATSSTHVFTYKAFMHLMHTVLTELGIPASQYGTHSLRRGGATFALEAGVPLDVISVMGDWKSDSMYLYLHMPLSQRLSAQHTIQQSLA